MLINNNAVLQGIDANKYLRLRHVLQASQMVTQWNGGNGVVLNNNTWNPASIWIANGIPQIEIAAWFYQNYSSGYILGMFCHEIGVHPMADATNMRTVLALNPPVRRTWARLNAPASFANCEETILATAGAGGLIQCAALGAAAPPINWQFRPSNAPQADHIFGSCSGYARYQTYRDLMLQFASIITNEINGLNPHGFVQGDLDDLFDCWLMDVGSIQGTSDHRGRGVIMPNYVAQSYNAHRAALVAHVGGLGGLPALLTARVAAIPAKTRAAVFSAYCRMLVNAFN